MKKKILAMLLATVLAVGLLPTVSLAADSDITVTEIVTTETYNSFYRLYEPSANPMVDFNSGVAWIGSRFETFGAIDTDGNVIIEPFTYDPDGIFQGTKAFSDGVMWCYRNKLWCAVDTEGNELFTLDYNEYNVSKFHDGLAKVTLKTGTKLSGYVDKTGEFVLPCEYSSVGDFSCGMTTYYDATYAYYGYMDKTGEVVIPTIYNQASAFVNGFAVVQLDNLWRIIDTTGKEIPSLQFSSGYYDGYAPKLVASDAFPDITRVERQLNAYGNGETYFINKNGETVAHYNSLLTYSDGLVLTYTDDGYAYVNEAGEAVIPAPGRNNNKPSAFFDGYATIRDSYSYTIPGSGTDPWGYPNYGTTVNVDTVSIFDKTGTVTATLSIYDYGNLTPAGNGCFVFGKRDGNTTRYGVINYKGKEIMPARYAQIGEYNLGTSSNTRKYMYFSGGVAAVKTFDGKWGFIDTTGKEVVPCTLTGVTYTSEPGIFVVTGYNGKGFSVLKFSGWTAPEPEAPAFSDVSTDVWYYNAVNWAVTTDPQITIGATSTTFEPEETCKQVQILTFLWRAEGRPTSSVQAPIKGENDDFQGAMNWAYDKGMITDSFNPNAPCTRSDAVKYIWQAFGSPTANTSRFTDVDSDADYAKAVDWAVANGIVAGYEDNTFKPTQTCERAHIITFLFRTYVSAMRVK